MKNKNKNTRPSERAFEIKGDFNSWELRFGPGGAPFREYLKRSPRPEDSDDGAMDLHAVMIAVMESETAFWLVEREG